MVALVAYWMSDAWNPATWEFASSIISLGLTWRESLSIVAVGFFTVSIVIALNGSMGVLYHAPFPVLARASWGFWGSYVAIISRSILSVFWFSIQSMNGANAVRVMLGAIWPSFLEIPNSIPEDQGITTQQMTGFVLFWLAQLPFLCLHPNNLRWLFIAKSVVVPVAWIAIMIWAFVSTCGSNQPSIFDQTAVVSGSAYSWAYLSSLTSVIGNYATLSVNQADFSRYSHASVKWQWLYVPFLPLLFTFIAFIGIAATSAGTVLYPSVPISSLWDPMVLISQWGSRACRFFAAFSFALASLGVNISANSLSFGCDAMALAPRFLNIRRGQLLCALLCWALVPWKILASAGSFLNFMSAYAVFLGPIAAIIVTDFFLVHGRKYDALSLYKPEGIYRYNAAGVNWRAIVAFLVGVAPSLPGFINSINMGIEVGVGVHPYQFGWLLGFATSVIVYWPLSILFPANETFIDVAVRPDEIYDARAAEEDASSGDGIEGIFEAADDEKKGFRKWADKVL